MVRTLIAAVVLAAPLAWAQVAAPVSPARPASPPPAPVRATSLPPPSPAPATRPAPAELHAQAYAFMRDEQFDKATPLLNRAFNETPAPQRSRALILNRALLDLVQKVNPMRGIKDLHQYLTLNHAPDEQGSNILASLLELAAQNKRWRDGPLYADAHREFARREAVLERHRPGFKRWGHRWITQEEFDAIKDRDKALELQIDEQGQLVSRLSAGQISLHQQYTTVANRARGFANHVHVRRYNDPVRLDPQPCASCTAMYEAQQSINDISAEMQTLAAQLRRETAKLEQLKTRRVKPQWPRRYPPIDPNAPPPPPPLYPAVTALEGAEPAVQTDPADGSLSPAGPTGLPPASPSPLAPPTSPATRPAQSTELIR